MKVYISKYKDNWISPYSIIEHCFFWTDWSKCARRKDFVPDSEFIDHPVWVDKWAYRIEPISKAIQWVLNKLNHRVEYVKIDRWDTWAMDSTLALIVVPMLKQLKETKHGVPGSFVHNDDGTDNPIEEAEKKWNEVLDKMIFAFESLNSDWEEQFYSGKFDLTKRPGQEGWLGTHKTDIEGIKAYEARMDEGFELFGKHYRNLWD